MLGFGLNKPRSKFGKFLDKHKISQSDFADKSGLGRNTVSRLCNVDGDGRYESTLIKAVSTLRKMGFYCSIDDFW